MTALLPYVEHAVIVSGRAAIGVSVLVDEALDAGVLDGLPVSLHDQVLVVADALRVAAEAQAARMLGVSVSGNENGHSETRPGADGSPSPHVSTSEAAVLLGVSDRRARGLARGGLGRKVAGRWVFDRGRLAAELRRRREAS